jgi:hypothetical protein
MLLKTLKWLLGDLTWELIKELLKPLIKLLISCIAINLVTPLLRFQEGFDVMYISFLTSIKEITSIELILTILVILWIIWDIRNKYKTRYYEKLAQKKHNHLDTQINTQFKKSNEIPCPNSEGLSGKAKIHFGSYDGRHSFGHSDHFFEVKWQGISIKKIRIYNDSQFIKGVSLAKDISEIKEIQNNSCCDFTNRTAEGGEGDIFVVENVHGYFAAFKILEVKVKGRGDSEDLIVCEYKVQPNKICNFLNQEINVETISYKNALECLYKSDLFRLLTMEEGHTNFSVLDLTNPLSHIKYSKPKDGTVLKAQIKLKARLYGALELGVEIKVYDASLKQISFDSNKLDKCLLNKNQFETWLRREAEIEAGV